MSLKLILALLLTACGSSSDRIDKEAGACDAQAPRPPSLRVASYNIKSMIWTPESRRLVPEDLRLIDADFIGLQEVDWMVARSDNEVQPSVLANELSHPYWAFAAARTHGDGVFGNAAVSRHPFRDVRRIELQTPLSFEPRVALDIDVCVGSAVLRVIVVHADVVPGAGSRNLKELVERLGRPGEAPAIILGDFNSQPDDDGPAALRAAGWVDVFRDRGLDDVATFSTDRPQRRIDYFFVTPLMAQRDVIAIDVPPTTRGSDHRPIVMDLRTGYWPEGT